jgi:hypothetical protein
MEKNKKFPVFAAKDAAKITKYITIADLPDHTAFCAKCGLVKKLYETRSGQLRYVDHIGDTHKVC